MRRNFVKGLTALAIGVCAVSSTGVQAQAQANGQAAASNADPSATAADAQVVAAAVRAFNSNGYIGLTPDRLSALRAVLERGETGAPGDPRMWAAAALLLASEAVEHRRYEEGLRYAERGLALRPDEEVLLFERGAANLALRRPEAALQSFEAAARHAGPDPTLRARILRNQGVALIDLGRLDEAEQVLNEAMTLQPGDPRTQNELNYIAQLREGAAHAPAQISPNGSSRTDDRQT